MHISADDICMKISGGRTKQLDIFCHVTGFTSYFLSFIVVELIQFFHGALQMFVIDVHRLKADSSLSLGNVMSLNLTKIQV